MHDDFQPIIGLSTQQIQFEQLVMNEKFQQILQKIFDSRQTEQRHRFHSRTPSPDRHYVLTEGR